MLVSTAIPALKSTRLNVNAVGFPGQELQILLCLQEWEKAGMHMLST